LAGRPQADATQALKSIAERTDSHHFPHIGEAWRKRKPLFFGRLFSPATPAGG